MIIGVSAGAIQGYFGGKTDLFFQRFMEVWSAIPTLYVLIILASVIQPNFWWLLDRPDSIWYPNLSLYRQTKPDDWESVFVSIRVELKNKLTRVEAIKDRLMK